MAGKQCHNKDRWMPLDRAVKRLNCQSGDPSAVTAIFSSTSAVASILLLRHFILKKGTIQFSTKGHREIRSQASVTTYQAGLGPIWRFPKSCVVPPVIIHFVLGLWNKHINHPAESSLLGISIFHEINNRILIARPRPSCAVQQRQRPPSQPWRRPRRRGRRSWGGRRRRRQRWKTGGSSHFLFKGTW